MSCGPTCHDGLREVNFFTKMCKLMRGGWKGKSNVPANHIVIEGNGREKLEHSHKRKEEGDSLRPESSTLNSCCNKAIRLDEYHPRHALL